MISSALGAYQVKIEDTSAQFTLTSNEDELYSFETILKSKLD